MAEIAAYCRVSTDKSDQLNSIAAQREFFEKFAQKHGHNLVRVYADEGLSGTRIKNRREFLHMMSDARLGMFRIVVVKDISRLSRNTVDLLQSTRELSRLGVETHFITADMSVLGNSEFVLTIFGALAQEESANTSKRIKFGKKLNAERGRVPNLVYGYDKIPGDYFSLSINEKEASVVREIFDDYVNQGLGFHAIARRLNEKDCFTKRGCLWSMNAVGRILENEIYTGVVINGKSEVADFLTGRRVDKQRSQWLIMERPDLTIVERKLFEGAQRLHEQRARDYRLTGKRNSGKHIFSTLITCSACGHCYRRLARYGSVDWVCSGRNGVGADSCPNDISLPEDALLKAITDYFREITLAETGLERQLKQGWEQRLRQYYPCLDDPTRIRQALQKQSRGKERYLELYAEGLISRKDAENKISSANEEIGRLKARLLLLEDLNGDEVIKRDIASRFPNRESIADAKNLTNSRLKQIVDRIEAYGDEVDIYLRLF